MTKFISAVWNDKRITKASDLAVLHVLADNCDEEGTCWMEPDWIEERARCKLGSIRKTFESLERRDLIRIRMNYKTMTTGYQVLSKL